MDPDEYKTMGFIKRMLGIITKSLPSTIKLFHMLKLILFFVLTIFTIITLTSTPKVYTDPNTQLNATLYTGCNITNINTISTNYHNTIIIFYGIEGFSVCMTLCLMGILKSLIPEEAILCVPDSLEHSSLRRLFFRSLGP